MPENTGRRVLVIGGSGAVGHAVCVALRALGARVGLTAHTRLDGASAQALVLGAEFVGDLDVRDPAAIMAVVEAAAAVLGGLDGLVYAAATAATTPASVAGQRYPSLDELDAAAWDETLAVNARGAFLAARAAAPHLRAAGRGNVVFVGSIDATRAVPAPAPYAASKGALVALARALGKELGPDGVCVNVVSPGLLDAGLATHVPPDVQAEFVKHAALARPGRPAEVARLIAWLVCENRYLQGQNLSVSGGL